MKIAEIQHFLNLKNSEVTYSPSSIIIDKHKIENEKIATSCNNKKIGRTDLGIAWDLILYVYLWEIHGDCWMQMGKRLKLYRRRDVRTFWKYVQRSKFFARLVLCWTWQTSQIIWASASILLPGHNIHRPGGNLGKFYNLSTVNEPEDK